MRTSTNWWQVITFFILYNNLIPIFLKIVKFIQAYYKNWYDVDKDMVVDAYALTRTS